MALIPCPECGKQISDKAQSCPMCGIPNSSNFRSDVKSTAQKSATERVIIKKSNPIGIISIIVVLIVVVAGIGANSSSENTVDTQAVSSNSGDTQTGLSNLGDQSSSSPTEQNSEQNTPPQPLMSVANFIKTSASSALLELPTEASGNYEELCEDKWTNAGTLDHEQYAYCINEEQDGYRQLAALANRYDSLPNAQALLDSTIAEWTKNGYRDDNEIQFVFKEQISDFDDFKWLASSAGFNEDEGRQCIDEWTKGDPQYQNWSEIDYCYKQMPDFVEPPPTR